MHKALYRKYRPAVFDDVCGQEHITSVLKYQCASDKVSHAYLFCGSRGTGKTSCAKILAKAVNCEAPENGNPCGKCQSCIDIDSGAATDVVEMDAASNNGVDYIREIRDEVIYTPAMLKKRVYIIDEVHMLSSGAFNALLKTLEEPPSHVIFILATTELHELPATIISRCQRFDFRRITSDVICRRLYYIAEKEHISLSEGAAHIIARQAQGGMRDAVSLFELCAGSGGDVTEESARETLGVGGYEILYKTAAAMAEHNIAEFFSIISEIESSSGDISVFWRELISFYRDMMVSRNLKDPGSYLDLTENERIMLSGVSERFNLSELVNHCRILDEAAKAMRMSPEEKRTIAEFAMIRICNPSLDVSPEAISARISALEDKIDLIASGAVKIKTEKADESLSKETAVNKKADEKKNNDIDAEEDKTEIAVSEKDESSLKKEEISDNNSNWSEISNLSGVAEKISHADMGLYSFFKGARAFLSSDGKKVRVIVRDKFSANMLGNDKGRKVLSEAFTLCKITEGIPEISVEIEKKNLNTSTPMDEILG